MRSPPVLRPVQSLPHRARINLFGCCVQLSIGGRLKQRRISFYFFLSNDSMARSAHLRRLQMAAATIGRQRWRRQCGQRREARSMDGGGGSGGRRRQRTAGGGFMRCSKGEEDMSTNSHVCVHKLCSLCVRSQEFNSRDNLGRGGKG